MSELLPLFPLSTVLFPGMRLPLHIFEERYRLLIAQLREQPEPRQFGVVAIRKGREGIIVDRPAPTKAPRSPPAISFQRRSEI